MYFEIHPLRTTTDPSVVGTAGGLLIENYVPAILYNDGYKSEKEIVLSGANGDLTVGGGMLDVTTSNTATSTLKVGCIQMYATSTATALRMTFTATSSLLTQSSGVYPSVSYGTCPI